METTVQQCATALSIRNVTKTFASGSGVSLLDRVRRRASGNDHRRNGNGAAGAERNGDRAKAARKHVCAVDGVSLQVRRNEIFGILGPNGSGKSTLIRLMATLLLPDSGAIEVFGLDVIRDEMQVKRLINRVSVDAAFFKKLSSLENLMYAGRLYGLSGREVREQAFEILHRLGLKDKEITGPLEDMSRGMQQKVAIARAFLSHPTLLLLDEPTTGLDPRSKREVQAFVRELRETHDATILLTTHDMHEAEALCDRIAILDEGRVVALDTPEGLKNLVLPQNGHRPTLEDVFMELTGKELIKEEDMVTV
ncbi:MAG: ABC transporter ATP-binding protein [Anaerolineae bacterium]|nr:ABC transporter ATP-binding protein [Anaerolineae bacterium]